MASKAPPAGAAPVKKELSKSDASKLRALYALHDEKQYKKGIKAADELLSRHPGLCDALAVKGLMQHAIGEKSAAYGTVRVAISSDVKSSTAWHAFGMLYRSDRQYGEAFKSYKRALACDVTNGSLLRDVCHAAAHMRDVPQLCDLRRQMLVLKSDSPSHWLGLALAHALASNARMALAVVQQFESSSGGAGSTHEAEQLKLFKGEVEFTSGSSDVQFKYDDSTSTLQLRIDMYLNCGDWSAARASSREYIDLNCEDMGGHAALQHAELELRPSRFKSVFITRPRDAPHMNLNCDADRFKLTALYLNLALLYPTSSAVSSILADLSCPTSTLFTLTVLHRLEARVQARVPPHVDIARFYDGSSPWDEVKYSEHGLDLNWRLRDRVGRGLEPGAPPNARVAAVDEWIKSCLFQVDDGSWMVRFQSRVSVQVLQQALDGMGICTPTAAQLLPRFSVAEGDSPSVLLYMHMLAAAHDLNCGRIASSLAHADAAVAHTPTSTDALLLRASIRSAAGQLSSSHHDAALARGCDKGDRYLNSISILHACEACDAPAAVEAVTAYGRDEGVGSDPLTTVHLMQMLQFESACMRSHLAVGDLNYALKAASRLAAHMRTFSDDMWDYHAYCLRRWTMTPYMQALAVSEAYRNHEHAQEAAAGTIQVALAAGVDAAAAAAGSSRALLTPPLAEGATSNAARVGAAAAAARVADVHARTVARVKKLESAGAGPKVVDDDAFDNSDLHGDAALKSLLAPASATLRAAVLTLVRACSEGTLPLVAALDEGEVKVPTVSRWVRERDLKATAHARAQRLILACVASEGHVVTALAMLRSALQARVNPNTRTWAVLLLARPRGALAPATARAVDALVGDIQRLAWDGVATGPLDYNSIMDALAAAAPNAALLQALDLPLLLTAACIGLGGAALPSLGWMYSAGNAPRAAANASHAAVLHPLVAHAARKAVTWSIARECVRALVVAHSCGVLDTAALDDVVLAVHDAYPHAEVEFMFL